MRRAQTRQTASAAPRCIIKRNYSSLPLIKQVWHARRRVRAVGCPVGRGHGLVLLLAVRWAAPAQGGILVGSRCKAPPRTLWGAWCGSGTPSIVPWQGHPAGTSRHGLILGGSGGAILDPLPLCESPAICCFTGAISVAQLYVRSDNAAHGPRARCIASPASGAPCARGTACPTADTSSQRPPPHRPWDVAAFGAPSPDSSLRH